MNPNIHTNFQRKISKSLAVIGNTIIFEERKYGNCKVKVLPWQQFLSEFAENCREVMLDLYEDIVKVRRYLHVFM